MAATELPARAEVGAYILAGGASRRMGQDKARLAIAGEPLVHVLARRLEPFVARVALVVKRTQEMQDLGLGLVLDASEEHALVHGIRAALLAPGPTWRFLLACDMPAVGPEILARLWQEARARGAPGCCLRRASGFDLQPLPSLWHADLGQHVQPSWGLMAREWLRRAGLAVYSVDAAEEHWLANVNSPTEWREWCSAAGETMQR